MIRLFQALALSLILLFFNAFDATAQLPAILIAHRGGVVDSTATENGISALQKAVGRGFTMIETDVRVTKDGILIAHHDADFKRYYGLDKKVTELEWAEIKSLKSNLDQNTPLKLEEVLRFCKAKKVGVMLDIKIAGMDTAVFDRMIALLDQYELRKSALAIGTDESTEYLTGKIRLSCSRAQLKANMQRPGYKAEHYYFFERAGNLAPGDVKWASRHGVLLVAAVNKFLYRNAPDMLAAAKQDCQKLLGYGVKHFQIDSEFQPFVK